MMNSKMYDVYCQSVFLLNTNVLQKTLQYRSIFIFAVNAVCLQKNRGYNLHES